jgi:ATP-binding cassette, subfamily B, bacterial
MSSRIESKDTPKEKLTKEKLASAVFIFKYIKPYMGYFVVGMIFLVLGSLIFMLFPGAAGEMANKAVGKVDLNLDGTVKETIFSNLFEDVAVKDFWLIFLIILVTQGILSYFRTNFFSIVSEKGMADLRKDLFNKIITQRVPFFEERRVGELTSRITTDVEQLQTVFSITLAELLRQVVVMIAGITIIAIVTPKLSLLMLLTFPIIVISAVIFGRYIRKLSKARQDQLADTNSIVEECFQSFMIVKSYANEWFESIKYGKAIDKVVDTSLKFAKIRGLFFVFIITVLFGAIFFILWRGALMVQDGSMEAGDLFSFIIYTGILGGAIASFGNLYTTMVGALGATERIREILLMDSEVDIKDSNIKVSPLKGDIVFDNVQFAYPSRTDIQVLKGININIKSGEKIAIVGQSGSGKSTIVQLLMKFYDISGGSISIDGIPVANYNPTHLRQNVGIVPQEVIMFGGTIKENILYGRPSATDEELINAAKQANAYDFVMEFPEQFETVVGERGIKLSGGQRQRIAIARAILRNPSILILDEATSSLDAESEKIVQDALDKLMQNRTSIIIAHRLATIKDVDCIYVIENGKIVEQGNHTELAAKEGGVYSHLAKLQFDN